MKKGTKIFIAVISILVIVTATGSIGFWVFHTYQEQQIISTANASILEQYTSFKDEENRLEKLDLYETFQAEADAYIDSDDSNEEVTSTYQSTLKKMKRFFTDDYDNFIHSNTLSKKSTIDKDTLNASIKNLSDELAVINIEKDTVLSEDEFSSYEETLNDLITEYTDQIAALEKDDTLKAYDKKIKDNTLDMASVTDQDVLSRAKDALASCLDDIESDDICDEEELSSYQEQINSLIAGYEAKLSEIELAAAEEAQKAAEQQAEDEKAEENNKPTSPTVPSTYDVTTWRLKCDYNGTSYLAPDNVSSLYFDQGHTIEIRIQEDSGVPIFNWYDTVTGILYDNQGKQIC